MGSHTRPPPLSEAPSLPDFYPGVLQSPCTWRSQQRLNGTDSEGDIHHASKPSRTGGWGVGPPKVPSPNS